MPHGDSCAFCLTLASRGWQRASQAAIKGGHAEHIHANCDCEYAVRFDGRTSVAGYDPEAYLAQYNAAGGDINRMRRVNYAKNKERINAQKRAAYALRQKNRGKKVAITDIAIQKVPLVAPNGANDQTAFFIQETHKELLRFAQKWNDSNEAACLIDLTTREKLEFVKGDQISVNVEADAASYHWLRSKPEKSVMLCHNHPGQSYYSMNDIRFFLIEESVGALSIVTNQGKVWSISKTDKFERDTAISGLAKFYVECGKDADETIDKFLKSGYTYGIRRD